MGARYYRQSLKPPIKVFKVFNSFNPFYETPDVNMKFYELFQLPSKRLITMISAT